MKLTTILAATDFSECANEAVIRAATIAAARDVPQLEVLHVVNRGTLNGLRKLLQASPAEAEKQLVEEAEVAVRHLTEKLAREHGITVTGSVEVGNVAATIVSHAESIDASLIVLGVRGANLLREILLGTTAEKVIRRSTRPLLVVKTRPDMPYGNALVPVDFSAHSRDAFEVCRELVGPHARVNILHAYEIPFESKLQYAGLDEETIRQYRSGSKQEAEAALRQFASDEGAIGRNIHLLVAHGYPPKVIRENEQEIGADLIAIGKHGESKMEDLLVGSVSEHALERSDCDVLIAGRAHAGGKH
ncbi:MAG: universal stress protein [Burkholderiales bacterium]